MTERGPTLIARPASPARLNVLSDFTVCVEEELSTESHNLAVRVRTASHGRRIVRSWPCA